jgi:hypothetical protein
MFEYFDSIIQYKMETAAYDGIIEKIYSDFDKILVSLTSKSMRNEFQTVEGLSIPNCSSNIRKCIELFTKGEWMILIGQLVCTLTNSRLQDSTAAIALEILAACAFAVDDKEKLDRFLPFYIYLSKNNSSVPIKATCINYTAQLVLNN